MLMSIGSRRRGDERARVMGIEKTKKTKTSSALTKRIKKTYASGEVLMWYSQLPTFPSF